MLIFVSFIFLVVCMVSINVLSCHKPLSGWREHVVGARRFMGSIPVGGSEFFRCRTLATQKNVTLKCPFFRFLSSLLWNYLVNVSRN